MTLKLCLGIAVFLPLLFCPVIPVLGRRLGRRVGWVALLFPVLAVLALGVALSQVPAGSRAVVGWPWIPSLGLELSFLIDGFSLFFAFIVSGVGTLIFFYANFYLDDHYRHHGRFYSYLMLFMAAMLGTVLSNHLLGLFVFWELTGLASFLLIGFLHEEQESRMGARQALLVTGLTGLVMLAGVILVGQAAGSYELSVLLAQGLPWATHGGTLGVAMVLLMTGAFGKSAQIPFHFWLPNAMAAPTPVSAYLHSATMVKLGVFLAGRVFPLFAGQLLWAQWLVPIGFATMVLGALLALLSHDLKAILAYSTVSALGSFIGYYGLGAAEGVEHDYLHIANHVLYKGCLFMVAGVVAHATGVRDIRQLGGLMRRLPWLGATCLIAAASMAGLPGTVGFLSKEALLQEVFQAGERLGALGWFAAGAVVLATWLKVAFSARFFLQVFLGPESAAVRKHFHAPAAPMQWPPLLLAAAALGLGVVPGLLERVFQRLATPGLNEAPAHLAIWHGWTAVLAMSILLMVLGLALYGLGRRSDWRWARIPLWLRVDTLFEGALLALQRFSRTMVRWLRFDRPLDYLPILLTFLVAVTGGFLFWHGALGQTDATWREGLVRGRESHLRIFVAILMVLSELGVIFLRRWTTQLISLSVAGFLTTFYFVLYQAPDLALTQILVDTVSLVLILILLGRFPKRAEEGEIVGQPSRGRNTFHAALSVAVGVVVTWYIVVMTAQPHPDRIGRRFLDTTVELAEGTNAVNTILVDYRGFDTLGEITVLFIAVLACLGLLLRRKRTAAEFRRGPLLRPGPGWNEKEGAS